MSDKKIGALWKKTTRTGKVLLTGNVEVNGEKIKLAVFENGYKEAGTRQPDYIVYLDTFVPGSNRREETPPPDDDPEVIPF
jgi:hypothetical protein